MAIKFDKLKWIGVDLDNTIANNSGYPDFKLAEPIKGAKETLELLDGMGYKIIINTARPSSEYSIIEDWLIKHTIPFRRIKTGKELVLFSIDDRNVEFDGDWDASLKKVLEREYKER